MMSDDRDDRKSQTTWLAMLNDSLSMISEDELLQPDGEIDEATETVLGVAPLIEQRRFTYAEKLEEQATRMIVDARFTREGSDEKEKMVRKSFELTMKSSLLRDMLWTNLKDQFDCWAPHLYIGLRKDYVVVTGRRTK